MAAEMLAYSRSQGLFAGIDLSGGVLKPDKDSNARAYGAAVNLRDVVNGGAHVRTPAAARPFIAALSASTQAARKGA
jgi:lipid-binding SYLF domain-containing protein